MRRLYIFILAILFISSSLCAQNSDGNSNGLWVTVKTPSELNIPKVINNQYIFENEELDAFFKGYNITKFSLAFPDILESKFKNKRGLDKVYELQCDCDLLLLKSEIEKSLFDYYYDVELIPVYDMLYSPNDYTLKDGVFGPNWQLDLIQAKQAWDITHGNPDIKVAIVEVSYQGSGVNNFDLTHEDLADNIVYNNDPTPNIMPHGTFVAGCASAVTNNNKGISSIGFNTSLMLYRGTDINNWIHAVNNGARVLNFSFISCGYSSYTQNIINTLAENGAIIVAGAGNGVHPPGTYENGQDISGTNRASCGASGNGYGYPASYDKVLSISSVGEDNKYIDNTGVGHFTRNDSVDLCAPGYRVLSTFPNNGYGRSSGTSFSSPITAGLVALVLSVNPCLNFDEVEYILKETSDEITDGYLFPGLLGAGRINAYKAVLMASTYGKVLPITSNTTWSGDRFINDELIIEQGATLTITGTARFSADSKVIIKQGGKLIVDGGTLTNSNGCGDFWQGIQVYGTTNKNQFPENNPTHQGLLIIKNGGTIENAHVAVSNWKVDDYNAIGGVIQTNNAVFRNNRRDVAFMSYQNYNPNYTNKYRNLSKFTNTEFVTDDEFIEKGLTIQSHVTMWQVDGITFTNCHFSNDITTNKNNSSAPNRGVYSIDAGYTVRAGCTTIQPIGQQCPTASLLKSSFSGFQTAIEATGSGTTESVLIQQSDIFENIFGITISNLDNVSINRNDISMGDAGYGISLGIGAGIYDATGYIVEENNVLNNQGSGLYLGIGVSNSLSEDNRIYKNSLEDLTIGLIGQGVNHNSNYQKGLQFLCNKLTNNQTALNMNSDPINDGVRFYQGDFSPLKSAGNRFIGNSLDIDNSANSIVYIHNGGDTEPINYQGLVTLQYTSNVNSCPTSFGGGILIKSILLVLDSLNTELEGQTTSYNDLNFTYTSLIDDGNTEQFKDNIELNWSSDAWLLRSKLLASSPYLSSEVLLEAAKQNILPNGILLEILLANPDATRGERFINELKEVTNNTFPEYMLDYVRGNYDSRTLRTDMEGQLSAIHSELSNTRNWTKHLTKSKEEYNNQDRLEVSKLGSEIYNKVGLMDYYIEQGDFNKADSVLNSIENDKKYKDDLSMIENFGNYINFRSNLGERNLAQLDSTEIAYLQTLADYKGRVAGYAQNILCFFYNICYEKDLAFGNSQAKSMMLPPQNSQEELNNVLYNVKLYPNPANDYASIQWEIYDELKDANYRVVDLNGREQLSGVLGDNRGEQVLDTRKLKNGVYIIGIYNNNQLKVSKKLVIENQK